jgi:transcriptional regulator with XRE-family HTH domain
MKKRSYFSNTVRAKEKLKNLRDSEMHSLKSINKATVTFGEYIKAKRIDKKIKYNDLKEYLGCYNATLSKYMANEMFPSPQRMSLLCSVLEIDSVFLYALTNRIHPDLQWKLTTLIREDSDKVVKMVNDAFNSYMQKDRVCDQVNENNSELCMIDK